MANKTIFTIEAKVTCEDCEGRGCLYCGGKGFNREPVKFIADGDGNIIKVEVM